jgi:Fe-S cluster assembly iron-binding protein IscA
MPPFRVAEAGLALRLEGNVMLTMTDNAAKAVRKISESSGLEPDPGLRISAGAPTADGTPLELTVTGEAASTDQTVEESGARIYLEEVVAPALDDKVLDAQIEGERVQFALRDAQPDFMDGNGPGV